jgi:hypothetical protein
MCSRFEILDNAVARRSSMALLPRIQQLQNAGILRAVPAQAVIDAIDSLTECEFLTILSVHARLTGPNQANFDALILAMGF